MNDDLVSYFCWKVSLKKLSVDDTKLGPTLIPFGLAGFVNRLPEYSFTFGIFELCCATFVIFYSYNARRLYGSLVVYIYISFLYVKNNM